MPMYDFSCPSCASQQIDVLQAMTAPSPVCACGATMQRAWITAFPSVIQDTIDVHIKNGLCHRDGTPRHFTSKQELRRAEKDAKLVNAVHHIGTKGGDKSKHTTRWY